VGCGLFLTAFGSGDLGFRFRPESRSFEGQSRVVGFKPNLRQTGISFIGGKRSQEARLLRFGVGVSGLQGEQSFEVDGLVRQTLIGGAQVCAESFFVEERSFRRTGRCLEAQD